MLGQNGLTMTYTEAALRRIAELGYDPFYGARPVKRTIQREVINALSKRILAGDVDRSRPICLDAREGELQFSN